MKGKNFLLKGRKLLSICRRNHCTELEKEKFQPSAAVPCLHARGIYLLHHVKDGIYLASSRFCFWGRYLKRVCHLFSQSWEQNFCLSKRLCPIYIWQAAFLLSEKWLKKIYPKIQAWILELTFFNQPQEVTRWQSLATFPANFLLTFWEADREDCIWWSGNCVGLGN